MAEWDYHYVEQDRPHPLVSKINRILKSEER
jgi:hypothetical protein